MNDVILFSSKGAQAYAELRRRILTGELPPGTRLPQDGLAEALSMSITPLREAIRQLASENLVSVMAHRDVRVASVSVAEARHLLEVRVALEPTATRLAAERRDDRDLRTISEAASRLIPVNRRGGSEAIIAHRAFHRAVYVASHNDVLIRMLDDLWDKSDRYRQLGLALPEGGTPRTEDLHQHHEIAELIRSGDGAAAENLAREHIGASLSASLLELMGDREFDVESDT